PDINCFTGPNGAGKTNVLDALYYLAFTRGFRSSQDRQALQQGAELFFDGADWVKEGVSRKLACNFVKGKGKKVLLNQKAVEKMSDHIGQIPMVAILPQDTELINGPAEGRRRFLDMLISQYDHGYLQALIRYNRVLSQRNALLRQFGAQGFVDGEQLDLWDMQMLPLLVQLTEARVRFLEDFQPLFTTYFGRIVGEGEAPTLRHRSQVDENSLEGWQALLTEKRLKDEVNLYTSVGIHRDDLVFQINSKSVRNFGSQGQQKTFVISLKLAQYAYLAEQTGHAPILLLDDIFDKLDEHRLQQIAGIVQTELPGQIFITDTSEPRLRKVFAPFTEREVRFLR
ncbi:MAG: DNA replication/repair protein RecF, partial [Bacteroidota bacterium]